MCSFHLFGQQLALLSVSLAVSSDTLDAVKQSAALTLLRLLRASPEVIPIGEWTSRIIHLLNDQHMVSSDLALSN